MIGTPGHGKHIIDCISTCDKYNLMDTLCTICIPEVDDNESKMSAQTMIGTSNYSLRSVHIYERTRTKSMELRDMLCLCCVVHS